MYSPATALESGISKVYKLSLDTEHKETKST